MAIDIKIFYHYAFNRLTLQIKDGPICSVFHVKNDSRNGSIGKSSTRTAWSRVIRYWVPIVHRILFDSSFVSSDSIFITQQKNK